jgi:uncharacterized protein (DUF736 family)
MGSVKAFGDACDRSQRAVKSPNFRLLAGAIEFGAAWAKTSRDGRDYHSVKLDDPSFAAPIYASLVEAEDGQSFNLIWSRRNGD